MYGGWAGGVRNENSMQQRGFGTKMLDGLTTPFQTSPPRFPSLSASACPSLLAAVLPDDVVLAAHEA